MSLPVRSRNLLRTLSQYSKKGILFDSHFTVSLIRAELSSMCLKLSTCQSCYPKYKPYICRSSQYLRKLKSKEFPQRLIRYIHTTVNHELEINNDTSSMHCSDDDVGEIMMKDMIIIPDFVTKEEEQSILDEVEPYLKRLRYEGSHWDDAIHSYRETERKHWREANKGIIQRIRDIAFPKHVPQLSLVHVLDLSKDGYIKPHVDAVRFCGNTIAGLSLLSSAVMRLVHTENSDKQADILLKQRSLYIMKDDARYKYTHEVLKNEDSVFKGQPVPRDRRIAVICRNEPS